MATDKGKLVVTLPGAKARSGKTGKTANPTTHVVQTTIEDRLAFEQARRKNKSWGKLEDNALTMLPFLAWNAMRRNNETGLTWTEFTTGETAALDVSPYDPEEHDADEDADAELEVEGLGKDTPTEA